MKFCYYLYYRLLLFYKKRSPDVYKAEAISLFYGIIVLNLFSFYLIMMNFNLPDLIERFSTDNGYANRGIGFLIILFLFIPFYFFVKRKQKVFNKYHLVFENESKKEKRKNGIKVMFYLIFTVLFFLLGPLLALVFSLLDI